MTITVTTPQQHETDVTVERSSRATLWLTALVIVAASVALAVWVLWPSSSSHHSNKPVQQVTTVQTRHQAQYDDSVQGTPALTRHQAQYETQTAKPAQLECAPGPRLRFC